jgi:hypothetical protein
MKWGKENSMAQEKDIHPLPPGIKEGHSVVWRETLYRRKGGSAYYIMN